MITVTAAKILWAFGVVVWFAIRYPFQRRRAKLGSARSAGGRRDRALLLIAACAQFVIPLLYVATGAPRFADYSFLPAAGWAGLVALVAALILFRVTHKQLGRNWSVTLDTRSGHQLVSDGIYRYVRHPMYSSFFLFALAQLLLLPNWIAGPVGLVGIAILFGLRVGREEQLMIDTFGETYRAYMRRTSRIIPGVF